MSFETLKETLLQEARQRAERISADLTKQTKQEEVRIMNRAKQMEEEIIRQAESQGAAKARRLRQETELAGRAAVLAAKQEELNATKEALKGELLSLDEKEAQSLLTSLLKLAPDAGTIIPGEKHATILRKLATEKFDISDEVIPGEGGFVFRAADSEFNLTIGHLVDQLFNRYRAEIAQELFS